MEKLLGVESGCVPAVCRAGAGGGGAGVDGLGQPRQAGRGLPGRAGRRQEGAGGRAGALQVLLRPASGALCPIVLRGPEQTIRGQN